MVLVWSCLFIYFCNGLDGSKRFLLDTKYNWGPWSAYTQCTDCAKGSKARQRYCYDGNYNQMQGSSCGDYALQFSPCYQSDCKTSYQAVDGGWSNWSGFTPCSVTCGKGDTTRYRSCTNPSPSNGGKPCLGHSREDYWCMKSDCPTTAPSVNGQWSTWSPYTVCSHSCGTGTTTRYRYCNNPPPSGNGYGCYGNSYETNTCNAFACSVDGGWSTWSHWSKCTTSCGLGVISRDRTCNNPVPAGNGAPCSGNHTDTHECSTGPCAEWSHWFEGDCSTSCGNGTLERLRHCSTGRDTDCTGVAYEMVPCSNVECI